MTGIGEMRRRLVLEAPVETPDGAGGVVRTYSAVATMWAAVAPIGASGLASRGDVIADVLGASVTHRIVIRAGREVTIHHRFREATRTFRVLSVRDPDRRFLEILAEERED